jgi:hypothetical protein
MPDAQCPIPHSPIPHRNFFGNLSGIAREVLVDGINNVDLLEIVKPQT